MAQLFKNIVKNLAHRPATRLYPRERREPPAGTRGHIDMDPGLCIYCGLCQKRCPANAIVVTRNPKSWTLDPYACVICGYCAEVCPKQCIYLYGPHRAPVA